MMNYILVTFSVILLAVSFALQHQYQKIEGDGQKAIMIYNLFVALFGAIIFWGIDGFEIRFTMYSVFMASAMALLSLVYTIIGFRLLKIGGMTLYTLFLMTGGMVVPYIWGLLFLDEPFSMLRTFGLLLIGIAVVLSNLGTEKVKAKQIVLCIAVFFLNGFVSVVSKLHQIETEFPTVSSEGFVMLTNLTKFIMCAIMLMVYRLRQTEEKEQGKELVKGNTVVSRKAVVLMIVVAAVSGISYLFQLYGAKELPATVLYPFITGGSILFSAICGYIVFKEKPSKRMWASIGLCLVGTLMFL